MDGNTTTAATANYKILGEIFPLNEDGSQQETALEVGSIQNVPKEVGDGWVEKGLAEIAPDVAE